jgi:hypothetical protein
MQREHAKFRFVNHLLLYEGLIGVSQGSVIIKKSIFDKVPLIRLYTRAYITSSQLSDIIRNPGLSLLY